MILPDARKLANHGVRIDGGEMQPHAVVFADIVVLAGNGDESSRWVARTLASEGVSYPLYAIGSLGTRALIHRRELGSAFDRILSGDEHRWLDVVGVRCNRYHGKCTGKQNDSVRERHGVSSSTAGRTGSGVPSPGAR